MGIIPTNRFKAEWVGALFPEDQGGFRLVPEELPAPAKPEQSPLLGLRIENEHRSRDGVITRRKNKMKTLVTHQVNLGPLRWNKGLNTFIHPHIVRISKHRRE